MKLLPRVKKIVEGVLKEWPYVDEEELFMRRVTSLVAPARRELMIRLKVHEKLSYAEVAQIMGLTVPTVTKVIQGRYYAIYNRGKRARVVRMGRNCKNGKGGAGLVPNGVNGEGKGCTT